MQQNTLRFEVLFTVLFIIGGSALLFGSADDIYGQESYASPRTQLHNGVDSTNVMCNDNRVLVQKDNSKIACVFETTLKILETRGWITITQNYQPIDESPTDIVPPPLSPSLPESNNTLEPTDLQISPSPSSDYPTENNLAEIPSDIATANNKFALDFYKQLDTNEKNVLFSPLGIHTAFSVLYEGARGNTAQELQKVFGFKVDKDSRHSDASQIMSSINRDDSSAVLGLANALWLIDGFTPDPFFSAIARDVYLSDTTKLGSDHSQNAGEINSWAANKTRDKIKQIVTSDNLVDVVLVITNAIYFNGTWVKPFLDSDTTTSIFWSNTTSSSVKDMMNLYEKTFDYTNAGDLQVLRLPYQGNRLSMLFVLPNERDGISSLEQSISPELLNQWRSELQPTKLHVSIPKFTIAAKYDLMPYLQQLGVLEAFIPAAADLTGISNSITKKLYVSDVFHHGYVDVNEEGTEAAAVTAILGKAVGQTVPNYNIPHFNAEHPFLFMIQDDSSGAILFMGKIYDPVRK